MTGVIPQLVSPTGADDYLPGHGDGSYDVSHYDLSVEYKLESNHLSGRATIDAVANVDLKQFALDLYGLRVVKVNVPGVGVAKYALRRGKLVITTKATIQAGQSFSAVVSYSGNPGTVPDKAGDAGWEELSDGVIVASQPGGAPAWFPCNDRPDNKATYRLTVTAPSDYYVVANGQLRETRRGASATSWVYDHGSPMATYLATVQIGRYTETELGGAPVPMSAVHPPALGPQLRAAFGRQHEMMAFFVRQFGPYPFDRYTVVVTQDELEIPLEAQGLSVFGSNFLSSDWRLVRLVAHELSHQWFGNSLTLGEWKDIWLHEGFACYAEWLWSEESGSRSAHERALEHWGRLADLPQDLCVGDPRPELMFDDRVYKRGALTLHALRLTLGDGAFFDLLRKWVAAHAYGTVSTAGFVAFTASTTGVDVGDLFRAWLFEAPLPDLPAGP